MKIKIFFAIAFVFVLIITIPKFSEYRKLSCAKGVVRNFGKSKMHSVTHVSNSSTYEFPAVEFYADNTSYWHIVNNEILFENYHVGDAVTILFSKEDPENSQILSLTGFWYTYPKMLLSALFFVAVWGILSAIFMKSRD